MKPYHSHFVKFYKSEHNKGLDVLPRRPLRIAHYITPLTHERIDGLCYHMTRTTLEQHVSDDKHCDIREVFMNVIEGAMKRFQPRVRLIPYNKLFLFLVFKLIFYSTMQKR